MTARKKLIEVALPLDAINRESAREKSIRHGHPSTLHLWWARRPLASCRAVILGSLVDDPDDPDAPEAYLEALDRLERPPTGADGRRERLFFFIERLVRWESTTDEMLMGRARELINLCCDGNPPPLLDPFCGGGSIALEGQRLGLKVYASDLNPVAVLITKAMVEIPPLFAAQPPVNPDDRARHAAAPAPWKGSAGLAADLRHYGKWMRDRAWERIGHLYPKGPNGETIIAWLWARTVKCPNPACGEQMPLVRSFWLSKKKDNEAWVEPVVNPGTGLRFEIRRGGTAREGTVDRRGAACVVCGGTCSLAHVRSEAQAGRMGRTLIGIVAEATRTRAYLPAEPLHAEIAAEAQPKWQPEERVTTPSHDVDRLPMYGMYTWGEAFTPRQLVALTTFSDLVGEARELALEHARAAGLADDGVGIASGGKGAPAYADAVATYLGLAVSKAANLWSSLASWMSDRGALRETFARQAIPMVWDFAEANPFSQVGGNISMFAERVAQCLETLPQAAPAGTVGQLDAAASVDGTPGCLIATDPPYYDNIGYADLSDFFYVWLRRSLGRIYPELFSTVLTPKAQELVASPYRFGGDRLRAERHFEAGLAAAFGLMRRQASPDLPVTLYYAYKQADAETVGRDGTGSAGWHTMLKALMDHDFQINGTWPVRTEGEGRLLGLGANALASSIVLACRPRHEAAQMATFQQFRRELSAELPRALASITGRVRSGGSEPWVDPIDLRQAAIGPGMAIYSRYRRVQKADGSRLEVPEALQTINEAIDAYFDEMEGQLDPTTRFCLHWYLEHGFEAGPFGRTDVLARATGVDPENLERRRLLDARGGQVRLLRASAYPAESAAASIWEVCHRLVHGLQQEGEEAAARIYTRMPSLADEARDLAYRLYLEAEKAKRADDALGYNALVASWTDIRRRASQLQQGGLGL